MKLLKKMSKMLLILLSLCSERRSRAIHVANLEKKYEAVEQQIEQSKLYQEQLITKGIEIIDFIKKF